MSNNVINKPKSPSKTYINFYRNISKDNPINKAIIEYSYPICIFKNINKESDELRKIKYRIICSKREKEKALKEKAKNKKIIKRNLSSNLLIQNNKYKTKNKQISCFKNNNLHELKKNLIRSNSIPIYPFCKEENNFYKNKYLSQIEKRSNHFNKLLIAAMQRNSLNNFSINRMKNRDAQNNNFILNNINQQSIVEEYKKKEETRQFINNRIFAVNEKRHNIDEYFIIKKRQILPKINKGDFKFHVYHDKNGREKELTKSPVRTLKMTKSKVRDLKIMSSINKIRDPEIIGKYKAIINNS